MSGKRAFISGSTQGIGFAIAEALAREGVAVIINGRGERGVDSAVARLQEAVPHATVSGIAADFGNDADVTRLLTSLGEVDILVNNVGLFEVASFDAISDDDWNRYLTVNLMSAVRLSRHALSPMIAKGHGRVIFIASESGVNVPADMIHYGVTKAAMIALSNGLAKLTKGTEVTVNSILGGPTYSDGVADVVSQIAQAQGASEENLKSAIIAQNQTSLLERFIEPREIANLAVYLASSLSSATNGAAVRADGGVLTSVV